MEVEFAVLVIFDVVWCVYCTSPDLGELLAEVEHSSFLDLNLNFNLGLDSSNGTPTAYLLPSGAIFRQIFLTITQRSSRLRTRHLQHGGCEPARKNGK